MRASEGQGGRMNSFKKTLITGLIAVALLCLIFFVLKSFWNIITPIRTLSALIFNRYIPGLEIVLLLIFILLIGFGLNLWEKRKSPFTRTINRIPFVGRLLNLFQSIKKTVSFWIGDKKELESEHKNKAWVLIKWAPGIYSLGLTSQTSIKKINQATGEELIAVLPTSVPFPATGVSLFFLPLNKIIPLDIPIDMGFELLMSAGLLKIDD